MIPLSVLDLSFVRSGFPPSAALRDSIDLARHCDALGFSRYWLAEHHNLPSVASPAPEIMIGQIAAVTSRIRVGSGGVMLPNHAPLMVAERFRMLEGLFPGRIDLGLGRAPGTDGVTAVALRRHQEERGGDEFLERLQELILWDTGGFPEGHPFRRVTAMPSDVRLPPIFLLGSSGYSARLSAQIGMGFAFAHHFATHDVQDAMLAYRSGFVPSQWRERPHAILAVSAVTAETAEEAERLASSQDLSWLRRESGEFGPLPSPEEAAAVRYTDWDRQRIQRNRARMFVGTPDRVRDRLLEFARSTQADEIMITSAIHDQAARRRSYTLLAEAFSLPRALAA
ncbi:LLM class flavin-dependent oxidoreductase [Enterovirga aerilata]|uniref:Luciferase-like monooxygenase n=1 Tax=Enterovirga aerilata TaxID=2730920 RepID=A0A849I3J3_9HYPH|nr:LLM class flavin-dependent oxidoreductase [Enterovirga sp. DB1703]NNM72214.1 LLM class flavin-dependent oxidoreductase [Enterovirga sp. DB1703]